LNTDAGSIAGENLPPEGGRYRPKSLLERNAYSGIGPPYRVAMMPNTINDDIKTRGNAESCGDLQQGSTVRNILDTVQSSFGALSLKMIEALFNTRLRGATRLSFTAAFRL
jgi:hypothetical protein